MKKELYQLIALSLIMVSCASKEVVTEVADEIPPPQIKKESALKPAPAENNKVEVPVKQLVTAAEVVSPKNAASKSALAAAAEYKKGHFDAALGHLNKAIKEHSNKSELYHNLGLIYLAKNDQREAIKAFRKGLQINPQDTAIATQLGAIFTKEKDYIKAEIALEIPVQKGTQDPQILNNYAIVLLANKKNAEAEKIYEKVLKANPGSRDIMLNYSIYLIDQKQNYKQGLDLLNRLKFVGVQPEARNIIKDLENRAKAGLK
jgi:tetratricopeptide (TPR) repeat protein